MSWFIAGVGTLIALVLLNMATGGARGREVRDLRRQNDQLRREIERLRRLAQEPIEPRQRRVNALLEQAARLEQRLEHVAERAPDVLPDYTLGPNGTLLEEP